MSAQPSNYRDWLRNAEDDLLTIEILTSASRVPWSIVCYHAQQAGEKYLKAFLVFHGRTPFRTHDLGVLLQECLTIQPNLALSEDDCDALSDYAVTARYPEDSPPAEDEAREAAAAALRVRTGVLARLPQTDAEP